MDLAKINDGPEPLNVEELLLRPGLEGFAVGTSPAIGIFGSSDNVRSKGFVGQLPERARADPKRVSCRTFPILVSS